MKSPIGLLWVVPCLLIAPLLQAQEQQQPQLHEEVTVRWWLVPVYAVDKAGAPVLNLTPDDLDIYIKNIKVDEFSLIKKKFQVTEAKNTVVTAPQPVAPVQKKMVFLVFDAAFSTHLLMSKAKEIADQVIAESDKSAHYVLLSIEPYAGLHYIFGPSRDLALVAKNLKKYVNGKRSELERPSTPRMFTEPVTVMSSGGGGVFNAGSVGSNTLGGPRSREGHIDLKHSASTFVSSLQTLNLVLGNFKEFSKVVYLYSCGIPKLALMDRAEIPDGPTGIANEGSHSTTVYFSPDSLAYDDLKIIGQSLNKSGALLFMVNPEGTRIGEEDDNSGERSLRLLAEESGGRYFEGANHQIVLEVNNMEAGYYEISFPDKPEYEGQELSFEIRSNKPDVQIFTVRRVGREKSFADMTELEKEVLVLNVLNQGPYAETINKVISVDGETFRDGDSLVCRMKLPPELARSEWSVFKVRRNLAAGEIQIEKEQIVSDSPTCEVRMAWKGKEYRYDMVLAHPKTGTILVWK